MNPISKIAVLGGTGKSGKYLIKELVGRKFHLKLLLRNPENFQVSSPLIEIIKGDARDSDSVQLWLEGCDAIISTLGQPRGEASIFSTATKNILSAMKRLNIHRYIIITGLNVDTPFDKKGTKSQSATDWMKSNYPETTLDKQVEYDLLTKSDINWTLVRLPLIELTDEMKTMSVSLEDCPGDKISSTDLACFLAEQLVSDSYQRKAPFIANI